MVKEYGSRQSWIEEMKSILVCDLFYQVVLDIASPLFETKSSNKYVLMAINYYSKWCEIKHASKHTIATVARFFEKEIICRFGV
jgi:hypothetical protein